VVEPAASGAIDLKLFRGAETIVIQCRHWVAQQVPHSDVHQLIGAMHTAGATSAIVITSGEFTRTAIEAAAKFRHVKLIDGMAIRAMLGKVAEPALPPLSLDDLPWEATEAKPASKGPVIAAVAAVIVMGVLLCTLYGVYIHEIQRAQMDAMRVASQRGANVARNVAEAPAITARAFMSPARVSGMAQSRPAIVHDAMTVREDVADWQRKAVRSLKAGEKATPDLP
jgi:hypothetical protein